MLMASQCRSGARDRVCCLAYAKEQCMLCATCVGSGEDKGRIRNFGALEEKNLMGGRGVAHDHSQTLEFMRIALPDVSDGQRDISCTEARTCRIL